jgi:hypothetical protein
LNYTTSIDPNRTVAEIQKILVSKGARGIGIEYDANGDPSAVAFHIETKGQALSYRLPCRAEKVQAALERQYRAHKIERKYTGKQHANRVAWRIVKDWIEAQMAIVESEMVDMAEVFMPYQLMTNGQTMYEVMQHKLLTGPVEE